MVANELSERLEFGRRRGISLLEVMFAIAIIVTGLMGVAILIPRGWQERPGRRHRRSAARDGQLVRELTLRVRPERQLGAR